MRIFSCGGGNLTLGYIENKRVNADFSRLIDESNANPKAQIAKYLTLSQNLILTDYLRFLRVAKAPNGTIQITQEITLCALNEIHSTLKSKSALESKQSELLEFFALFFSSTPKPINTAQEFALCLAQRTRLLKDALIENNQNPQISALYQSFRDILYKDLDFPTFCDSFAQTLTYALFLARLNDESGEIIDLYNAKKFIPKSFPLIRAMSGFLDNLDELDSLKWLIKEILGIINHIDPSSITKELNKIAQKDLLGNYLHKDPYLHFYETFLSQYDPKLRELRGVYYTPFAVVSFIINAIDSTLKSDFSQAKGLGSALSNDNITLLDFATGTGTFLLEAFRKALDSTPPNSLHYKPKNLLPKFSGFEFLIAPYTIAHLKISQSFKEEFNATLEDNEKLNILLTNTIYTKSVKDEQNQKSNLFGMYELAQEFLQSQKLKNEQILIITGNPPYSGASANKGIFEDEVKIAYGLEPSKQHLSTQAQRIIRTYLANPDDKSAQKDFKNLFESRRLQNEKTPKWLLDDYVKFIRFAESKIESQDSGIIAIISNHGFIDNPTFRGMRYHLLNTFDKIYILDLHGNVKKKEKALDGSKDDNVFDIMQGVCISVFVKTSSVIAREQSDRSNPPPPVIARQFERSENNEAIQNNKIDCHDFATQNLAMTNGESHCNDANLAQVYHYDLFGKRKDKYDFLQSNGLESIAWSAITPKAPFYLFIPQNESLRTQYDKGISIKDIFGLSNVGITSGKDSFCISKSDSDKSLQELKNNITKFMKLDSESVRKEFALGDDSKSVWQIKKAQDDLIKTNNNPNNYVKIQYRPFDFRWTYYTSQSGGFLGRPRYEVMQHFLDNKISSISCESNSTKSPLPCGGGLGVGKSTHKSKNPPPLSPSAREGESLDSCNVGLVCDRGCKLQTIDNIFVANGIIDLHLVGSGSYIFPLYLVKSDSDSDESCHFGEKQSTLARHCEAKPKQSTATPSLRGSLSEAKTTKQSTKQIKIDCHDFACAKSRNDEFLDCHESLRDSRNDAIHCHSEGAKRPKNLNQNNENSLDSSLRTSCYAQNDNNIKIHNDKVALVENFTQSFRTFIDTKYEQRFAPEVILGYIYAVLFHKDYREKYIDFLKIDFPRIPFVKSKEKFLALSALGSKIIALHLMRGNLESITEPLFANAQNRNEKIEKIAYNADEQKLYVNESLYFSNVSAEVWEYKIGGYAVCEKYLKSHKGEVLDYSHFERVITTLHKSIEIEAKIAKIELE